MTDKILAVTTCESLKEARQLAKQLVDEKLAACVNILPAVESVYRWEGAVATAEERMLLIKTRRELLSALQTEVQRIHSYEIPELIAIPIVDGLESYLDWIDKETRHS